MKLQSIITTILIAASAISANGNPTNPNTTHKNSRAAHQAAHRHQLANARTSKIDRSIISDIILEDVRQRENPKVENSENLAMIEDLLSEARTHIGKRYRHGAKGPSAFDCSGFSSYVYRQFGYEISPSSRAQYLQGRPVDRKHLRKGDLVFFTSRNSGGQVGHVGIVVSADNEKGTFKFIHASVKGVTISDCEGYYAGRYLGAKRIIE